MSYFGCVGLHLQNDNQVWGRLLRPLHEDDEPRVVGVTRGIRHIFPDATSDDLQGNLATLMLQAARDDEDMEKFEIMAHAMSRLAGKNYVMITALADEQGAHINIDAYDDDDQFCEQQPNNGLMLRLAFVPPVLKAA